MSFAPLADALSAKIRVSPRPLEGVANRLTSHDATGLRQCRGLARHVADHSGGRKHFPSQANVPPVSPPADPEKTVKAQRDRASHVIGQGMQGKLAFNASQPSAPEARQPLLLA